MKLPFVLLKQQNTPPLRIRRLIASFAVTAVISTGCAIGALSTGRDQLSLWAAVMITFIAAEFFYAVHLTRQYSRSESERSKKEFHRRRKQQRLQK